jgi:hypothetical protein
LYRLEKQKKREKQRTESGEAEKEALKKWGKAGISKAAEKQRNREKQKSRETEIPNKN